MALRSLIPIEDIRVCHVNSEDNSTSYEPCVEYKAGTLVTYEGASYVAAIDIPEDDTDLPNEAPLKWGLVPNAFTSGGDDSGLASRVSALEAIVDNPDSTPTEDSTALVTSGGVYAAVETKLQYIAVSTTTSIFDLIDNAVGSRIYCGYASRFTNGVDDFLTLLGVNQYARVELVCYSPYLAILRVTNSDGVFFNGYIQKDGTSVSLMKVATTGNSIVTLNKATP